MLISVIFFWISLLLLFYCYFGYGILLYILNALRSIGGKKQAAKSTVDLPSATIIIAAYNEAEGLKSKIENTLAIDYPPGKLNIIFVTDGSTDASVDILQAFPKIKVLHESGRKGKTAAINRAMEVADTEIVVFSDANTLLNHQCIRTMMQHYSDPRIGGVAGEKKILVEKSNSAVGEAEGLYWQYESLLKTLDAKFNTVVGAAGELFSIRRRLFIPLDNHIILDDFMISMNVCRQGYRMAYEPGAYATELPSLTMNDEAKRKVRISAGAYQSIGYLRSLLNPFVRPLLSFQFLSRRLLRWVVCPVMLVMLLISNVIIVNNSPHHSFYTWFLAAQVFFYLLALMGWVIASQGKRSGIFTIPFYFIFMNYCLVRGFARFITGKHTVLWEKSVRQQAS